MKGSRWSRWYDVGSGKIDNNPEALAAKIDLREKVLSEVPDASVLDLYCGVERQMYEAVWKRANSYVACDARPWTPAEPTRFVADNRVLLRCLPLEPFNVFDVDAYGSPWEQMLILAHRRRWASGERGAVVLTDGSNMQMRFGGVPHAIAQLVGLKCLQGIPSIRSAHDLQGLALKAWVTKAGVTPVRMWIAEGHHIANGGKRHGDMLYMAVVFEGNMA